MMEKRVNYNRKVYLYVEEVLHDIDAELLKLSKLIAASGGEVNQELQTDETMNNRPLMLRRIERGVTQLEGVMQAYVTDVNKNSVGDNRHPEKLEYEFVLSFPENWQSRVFRMLPVHMHDYVVNWCLGDFLKSSYMRESVTYDERANESLWNVKHCVTSRVPESMRKPSGWF